MIHRHPSAAGFVPMVVFPVADTIFKSAVHLAGVTYFWGIAKKLPMDDMPWGVTASLVVNRRVGPSVQFDLRFPKTGGGEDIDYCRQKRQAALDGAGQGFHPAPSVLATHPWWSNGKRAYHRFFMWSVGDGRLLKMYPELTYIDFAPNSAELFIGAASLLAYSISASMVWAPAPFALVGKLTTSIMIANISHDLYRHLWGDADQAQEHLSSLSRIACGLAVMESSLIRMWSEMGRSVGLCMRGEFFSYVGRRFDWFAGRLGDHPRRVERRHSLCRFLLFLLILALTLV